MCIGSKTKISTIDDSGKIKLVSAEDLKIGDKIISPVWSEYDSGELIDHEHEKVCYDKMTNLTKKVMTVKDISSKVVKETLTFNNDLNKHFSTVQPILAKKQNSDTFAWEITRDISEGDVIMEYDTALDAYVEVVVASVQFIGNIEETVYRITPDEYSTFIAGNIICC